MKSTLLRMNPLTCLWSSEVISLYVHFSLHPLQLFSLFSHVLRFLGGGVCAHVSCARIFWRQLYNIEFESVQWTTSSYKSSGCSERAWQQRIIGDILQNDGNYATMTADCLLDDITETQFLKLTLILHSQQRYSL